MIIGDVESVLANGPALMQRIGDWQQGDSDLFAHFVQVNKQISESRWNRSDVSITTSGDSISGNCPDIESFVYVAVYFRQLFNHKRNDQLFTRVCERYIHFVDDQARAAWIRKENERFSTTLERPFFMLPGYSVEQLIEAFLYGASLFHGVPHEQCEKRKLFQALMSEHDRNVVQFALHGSLKMLQNHLSNAATVIYQDFSNWLNQNRLPLPNVFWHFRLFN